MRWSYVRVCSLLSLSAVALTANACGCDPEPLEEINCNYSVTPSGSNDPIEFPETALREERVRSFRIVNEGNTELSDLEFEWSEQNGQHYRIAVPDDGLSIRPGQDETVTIVFQPLVLSSNLGAAVTVSHPSISGVFCPAYNVVVDGSSFERPTLPDGGSPEPEPEDGGEPDVDGGNEPDPADGGDVDGGELEDGGMAPVDAGVITPPDAGIDLGNNPEWQSRGALRVPRADFASVLLDDGSILLVGGTGEYGEALASIERYDPVAGVGEVVATMAVPRAFPGALLLDDGNVVIAGGVTAMNMGVAATTIEVLDTADFTLTCPPPQTGCGLADIEQGGGLMPIGRLSPQMTVLPPNANTKVLVSMGRIVDDDGAWVLAPGGELLELGTPYSVASVPNAESLTPRRFQARVDLDGGDFVLFGGEDAAGLATDEIVHFSAALETFSVLTLTLGTPRTQGAAARLSDGRIVVIGGLDGMGEAVTDVELYDAFDTTPTREVVADFAAPARIRPTLTVLDDDLLLYASGLPEVVGDRDADESIRPRVDADLLIPFSDRYLRTSPDDKLAVGRVGHAVHRVVVEETMDTPAYDRVVFVGGHSITPRRTGHPDVETFSPDDNAFLSGLMGDGAAVAAAPLSPEGGVLTVGGIDPHDGALSTRSRGFVTETNQYEDYGRLAEARRDFTLTLLDDGGNFLVVGGRDGTGTTLSSASIYNPFLETDRALPVSLSRRRSHHTATLLDDGRVLLCGGQDQAGAPIDTCETFTAPEDPFNPETYDTASFALVGGRMSQGRAGHTATLLDTGEVLLAGGGDIERQQERADLFLPDEDRVRATGLPLTARRFHAAVALGSGRVLLVGGETHFAGFGPTSSAEVYERQNEVFRLAPDMQQERLSPAAFLLGDGRVLVAGGSRSSQTYPSRANGDSEVYAPGPTGIGTWEQVDIPLTFGRADVIGVDVYGRAMLVGGTHRDGLLSSGLEQRSPIYFVDRLVDGDAQ